MRYAVQVTGVGLALLLPLAIVAQERRAFEPGGAQNMIRVGTYSREKAVEREVMKNLSFTVDRNGKLIDTGGEKTKETVMERQYGVTLFVDEQAAREAFRPYQGQDRYTLEREGKLLAVVIEATFPKTLVLSFSSARKARDIREDLAEELRKQMPDGAPEMGKFVTFFRSDFAAGDSAIVRIADGQQIMTAVKGEDKEVLQHKALAQALLKIWVSKNLAYGVAPLLREP